MNKASFLQTCFSNSFLFVVAFRRRAAATKRWQVIRLLGEWLGNRAGSSGYESQETRGGRLTTLLNEHWNGYSESEILNKFK